MVKKLVLQIDDSCTTDKDDIDSILDINKALFQIVTRYKDKITEFYQNKTWDKYKKLSNEYELVFYSSTSTSNNISLYNPVSRSFFKLWEILHDFDTDLHMSSQAKMKCIFLAEGPGGFFEAVQEKRNIVDLGKKDEYYGITLKSCNNKMIPDWKMKKTSNINISYGKDGTGNLYNIDNILTFVKTVGEGSGDFITADGGFDFSSDFNNQEEQSFRLILSEVLTSLLLQKENGSFLLKVYDCFNIETIKLIHILKACYKTLNFIKPLTSRPANSERYILCTGYRGLSQVYVDILKAAVKGDTAWHNKIALKIPILDNIVMYNLYYTMRQVYYIQRTINYIQFFENPIGGVKANSHPTLNEDIVASAILDKHKAKSIKWCKKYNIPHKDISPNI
jgi:23S rRNA U2552 (ribose-2'-O)-methylase RlmE/FtsJ